MIMKILAAVLKLLRFVQELSRNYYQILKIMYKCFRNDQGIITKFFRHSCELLQIVCDILKRLLGNDQELLRQFLGNYFEIDKNLFENSYGIII